MKRNGHRRYTLIIIRPTKLERKSGHCVGSPPGLLYTDTKSERSSYIRGLPVPEPDETSNDLEVMDFITDRGYITQYRP